MPPHKYPGSRLQSAAGSARNCRNAMQSAGFAPPEGHFCPNPANGSVLMKQSLHCRRSGAPAQTPPPMHNDVRFALPAQLQGAFAPKKNKKMNNL